MLGGDVIDVKSNTQDTNAIDKLAEIRDLVRIGYDWWRPNFELAYNDLQVQNGRQWPDEIRKEREGQGRPCLTLNKLSQYIKQVTGTLKQTKVTIKLKPAEGDVKQYKVKNMAGTKDYTLAEVNESIIRNIEYASDAESQYDAAADRAIKGGWCWARVLARHCHDNSFNQELIIKTIKNQFAVICDPYCEEDDKSDADWVLIHDKMPRKKFERQYPGKAQGSLEGMEFSNFWSTEDHVRVCEIYRRYPVKKKVLLLSDGRAVYKDIAEPVLDELAEMGVTVLSEREEITHRVTWAKITAWDFLEEEREVPGTTIPLRMLVGDIDQIGEEVIYKSLIRDAIDGQRMHNFWWTAATERVALAPKSPWVATPEAIENFEKEWREANTSNRSVLRYNKGEEKPERVSPPPMPGAEIQMAKEATQEIKESIGMYDATLGNTSNEKSGRAIIARQRQAETGNFGFGDNRTKFIASLGRLLLELIPYYYDGERIMRITSKTGEDDYVVINQMIVDKATGKEIVLHDIAAQKFDLIATAGPAYQTARMEAAESMLAMVEKMPELAAVAGDLLVEAQDWPMAAEIAERLKKRLPPEFQDQDDPEVQKGNEVAMAEIKARQELEAMGIEAEKITAQAKIAEATMKLQLAQAPQLAPGQGQGVSEDEVRGMVARAIAEYVSQSQGAAR